MFKAFLPNFFLVRLFCSIVFDIALFLQLAIKSPIDLRPHTRIITRFEKKIQATLLRAWSEDPDLEKSS